MNVTRPLLSCTMRSRIWVAVASVSTTIWNRLRAREKDVSKGAREG